MTDLKGKPQIGVSACLARQPVRFDGCFISNAFVNTECPTFFELHTICPEVEMGMGIPRETIQLRDFDGETRLVYSKNPEKDITHDMRKYSERKLKTLPPLDGYIFKKTHPAAACLKYR